MTTEKVVALVFNKARAIIKPGPQTSADTIAALEELLADAKRGHVQGIAYIALYDDSHAHCCSVTGIARKRPIFTRGLLCALDDALRELRPGD